MGAAVAEPRVIHTLPGRVRIHVPGWAGQGRRGVETELRRLQGVQATQVNPLTGNALIRFDPAATDEAAILAAVRTLALDAASAPDDEPAPPPAQLAAPPVLSERRGRSGRARIAVRGLDRDPHLARRVVEGLERQPGVVRARASQLTGRVLVEFDRHAIRVAQLTAEVAGLELAALPGEDRPAHPLDPERLSQSATRTVGSALGLGLLGARRLAGRAGPPVSAAGPVVAASVIGVLEAPAKLEIDLAYVERQSLGLDLRVLAATGLLLVGRDALADRLIAGVDVQRATPALSRSA